MSKPSGGIRSLPSLFAWGLPTPVVALACIGNVIFRCFLVQAGNFISYGVCKFVFLGSPLGELSPQVTEGLPATAANRFHKELRFFFSLLKRKKEAKKEKSSRFTCTVRQCITRRYNIFRPTKIPRRGEQAAAAAVTLPFSQLKLGRKVSGDSPRKEFAFHLYYTANAPHEVPPCYILTSPTNLRQHRTKSVWRLCTPSACKFPV
ncbi:hypothetical protein, partial [uncultured Ruminococcus sp.]|uniref:hypothetical protein n=1 Tax=uncultured Ruminococcus sp. TaxID=165186 RepID=UPI0025928ADE